MNLSDAIKQLEDIAAKANDIYTKVAADPNLKPIEDDVTAIEHDIQKLASDIVEHKKELKYLRAGARKLVEDLEPLL